jgi:hypothetical protein
MENYNDRWARCDLCSCLLPPQKEPVTVSGWYSGREYNWRDGNLEIIRRRCSAHRPGWQEEEQPPDKWAGVERED